MHGKKDKLDPNDLAFLQGYLVEMFSHQTKCEENFRYTNWYLDQKYEETVKETVFNYFETKGIECDCGVVEKLNYDELELITRKINANLSKVSSGI